MHELANSVVRIAKAAGAITLQFFRGDFEVNTKAGNHPVTQADLETSKFIVEKLIELTPETPILSEEADLVAYSIRKTWSKFWLVDPLDGTKEFIDGRKEYTVNICLIEENAPVLAVIYAPALDQIYASSRDCGTYVWDRNKHWQRLFARKSNGCIFR